MMWVRSKDCARGLLLAFVLAAGCLERSSVGQPDARGADEGAGTGGSAGGAGDAGGAASLPDASDSESASVACPDLQYRGALGTVSGRTGVCDFSLARSMFGFGLYLDCNFVPPSQLVEAPGPSDKLDRITYFTLVGDACAYLEAHPSARVDVVYLPGPHGGP